MKKFIFFVSILAFIGCCPSKRIQKAIRTQEKYTIQYIDKTLPLLDKEKDKELIGIGERLKRNAKALSEWAGGE